MSLTVYVSWSSGLTTQDPAIIAIQDKPEELRRRDQKRNAAAELWYSWVLSHLGSIVENRGDTGSAAVGADQLGAIDDLRHQVAGLLGQEISIGIGLKIEEAVQACAAARRRGGNCVVFYTDDVQKENSPEGSAFSPPELSKAEGPFRSAGFRHRTGGHVVETGQYHDIGPWLLGGSANHLQPSPANSSDWESGFITHDGKFMNREEAAAHVNLGYKRHPITGKPRSELDSSDIKSGLGMPGFQKAAPQAQVAENSGMTGGFAGASRPGGAAGAISPAGSASAHSQGEAGQANLEAMPQPEMTHAASDFEQQFHDHADAYDKRQEESKQATKSGAEQEELKQKVIKLLQSVKQQAPQLALIQQTEPDLYQAIQGMIKSLLLLAHQLVDGGQPVAKSESLSKGDVVQLNPKPPTGKKFRANAQVEDARADFNDRRQQANADRTPTRKPIVSSIANADPTRNVVGTRDIYDYSHHLTPQQQQAGYNLHIHSPNQNAPDSSGMIAQVSHNGNVLYDAWALPTFTGEAGNFNVSYYPGSEAHGSVGLFSGAIRNALNEHAPIVKHFQARQQIRQQDVEPEPTPEPPAPKRGGHLSVVKSEEPDEDPILKAQKFLQEAAFRAKDGRVQGTGPVHDITALPDDFLIDAEGFLGHDGNFYDRRDAAAMMGTDGDLHSEDVDMSKAEKPKFNAKEAESKTKYFKSKDGIKIPASGSKERKAYDKLYLDRTREAFSNRDIAAPKMMPLHMIAGLTSGNVVKNPHRYNLYRHMISSGDQVPPIVVQRNGQKYSVVDGSHRFQAAYDLGAKALPVVEMTQKIQKGREEPPSKFHQGIGEGCSAQPAEVGNLSQAELPMPEKDHVKKTPLPVGSQKDAGPSGTRDVGKVKIQHPEDGKTSWVSVRAGQVMSQDGHAISSRNPGGR